MAALDLTGQMEACSWAIRARWMPALDLTGQGWQLLGHTGQKDACVGPNRSDGSLLLGHTGQIYVSGGHLTVPMRIHTGGNQMRTAKSEKSMQKPCKKPVHRHIRNYIAVSIFRFFIWVTKFK
ncbi:hypothetical protein DdX_13119 [Ditylenchus destructor]|uniref:Uncharacterized protein n=1 Tax=Ditylenchus destructor TaxID=166010 RepID=A0AAD4QWS6_9BILA|nr:hypothetical protein DdX_13119 [Ditylenchus destructor]